MSGDKNISLATAAGIFLLAVALRLPTINSPFFYDDFHAAVTNPAVTGKTDLTNIFTNPSAFSSRPGRRMYRPITLLSYILCFRLFGANPAGWHTFNLLFHGIAAMLVFGVARRVFSENTGRPAAVAALLWSSHPLLNEAIVYQAARSSLLSAIAVLAGVYFHLSIKNEWRRISAVGACLIIGLGCKETAVVLPVLMLLCDISSKSDLRNRFRTYASTVLLIILYLIFRRAVLSVDTFAVSQPVRSVLTNLLTQATAVTAYFSRALWPVSLSIEWDWPEAHSILQPGFRWYFSPLIDVPFLLLLILCVAISFRRYPFFALGLGWFFAAIAPESSIIPLVQAANERRLYLPLAGIALLGGKAIQRVSERKRYFGLAATLTLVVCFSAITLSDSKRWSSGEAQWEVTLENSPSSMRGLHNLAAARLDAGKIETAEKLYTKLRDEYPGYAGGYMGLGRIYLEKGRFDDAEVNFVEATQLDLNNDTPWINLVQVYIVQKKWPEAETTARKGLEVFSTSPLLWNNLGVALASQGKLDDAIKAFDRALELNPRYENAARNRANAVDELKNRNSNNTPK